MFAGLLFGLWYIDAFRWIQGQWGWAGFVLLASLVLIVALLSGRPRYEKDGDHTK